MSGLQRVLVLAGGLTHERDVSLRSGRRVVDALRGVGLEATLRDADQNLLAALDHDRPDAVFIALHGGSGEDGSIRTVLELLGIPYVGSAPDPCRVAFDKASAKAALAAAGLDVPPGLVLPHATFRELGAVAVLDCILAGLGLPLMVKPVTGGSALGATLVRAGAELPAAMVQCFAYAETALLERAVSGVEVAVTVIDVGAGPVALPAVEIDVADGPYDYQARYTAGSTRFWTPARLAADVAERLAASAVAAHSVLGLADLSRTDCIVDTGGRVWTLEVNVAPGMTETSLLPLAVTAGGLELGVLCRDLLERAVQRSQPVAQANRRAQSAPAVPRSSDRSG